MYHKSWLLKLLWYTESVPIHITFSNEPEEKGIHISKKVLVLATGIVVFLLVFVFLTRIQNTQNKTQQLVGDINNDLKVNVLDYNILTSCYGPKITEAACTFKARVDLDKDGTVAGIDYNMFLRGFFTQQETERISPTPTPVSTVGERVQEVFNSILIELKLRKLDSLQEKDLDTTPNNLTN